jgi:hypothetical protein
MLFLEGRRPFTTGSATYLYQPATENETTPRILLRVAFDGFITTAAIDTGASFVILDPRIAEVIEINNRSGIPQKNVFLRNDKLDGYLHRISISLIANEGENITVDATTFIPELKPHQVWGSFPSIIGLNSCLERIRFAVDPSADKFYFGDLP